MKADRVVRSTCPYCGVGCQIDLNVKDDRIFRVDAPFDVAPNFGRLCVKGRFGTDFVHHPSRLTAPLIRRTGPDPGPTERRGVARGLARGKLGRGARPGRDAAARPAGPLRAGQHHGQRQRQGDERGQLSAPKVSARGDRHEQRRSLCAIVSRRQRRGPATGHRLHRHEQRHRRDARPRMLHGHRLEHPRDTPGHRHLPQAGGAQKRRPADRRRSAADRDDPVRRALAARKARHRHRPRSTRWRR